MMDEKLETHVNIELIEQENKETSTTNELMTKEKIVVIQHGFGRTVTAIKRNGMCAIWGINGKSNADKWIMECKQNGNRSLVTFQSRNTEKYMRITESGKTIDALGESKEQDTWFLYDEDNHTLESYQFNGVFLAVKQGKAHVVAVENINDLKSHTRTVFFVRDPYPKDNESSEYWIFDSSLKGPYNIMQIMQYYKSNKNQFKVQLASSIPSEDWYEFELKHGEENKAIKEHLPCLYKNFVEKVCFLQIHRYAVPDIPPAAKSKLQPIAYIIFGLVEILLHIHKIIIIPLVLFVIFIYWLRNRFGCPVNEWKYGHGHIQFRHILIYGRVTDAGGWFATFCLSIGLLLTPAIIVFILQQYFVQHYQQWLSIRIAYVTWGILSFIVIGGQDLIDLISDMKYHRQMRRIIDKYSFMMAGITSEMDVFTMQGKYWAREDVKNHDMMFSSIYRTIPAMTCIIPSAVIGYIANYIMDEKFILKCKNDYTDDTDHTVCFGSRCCTVLSSTLDLEEPSVQFIFIPSVLGNIVAFWAIVKIMVWLYAQGHPVLSRMTSRSK